MRIFLKACGTATVGLIAALPLGVAGAAETPATPAPTISIPRTVSVEGVAKEPIEQTASASTATTVYRQGMADAIADGLAKAQFLAGKAGAAVGAVQSMAEGGGYIGCTGEGEYLGAQPDFGSAGRFSSAPPIAASGVARPGKAPKPAAKHHKKKPKHVKAKKAITATCTLSTEVALTYQLG